jgi:2-keto-3-deoxy-L-rhamnonate aldolase RhmA
MLENMCRQFAAFQERLKAHQPVFGLVMQSTMTASAEIVSQAGYDFAWIDMEHTTMTFGDVERLVIAVENRGGVPLVRVRQNEANGIGQVLDMGARIVSVPHVDTVDEARRAVQGAKYYPLGRRGFATCSRSTRQGMHRLDMAAMQDRNEAAMLMVQIESEKAVRNAAEIAAVEGVDILFVGCADLGQDMGISHDPGHPKLREALAHVSKAIKKTGKIGGIIVSDPSVVPSYCDQGFNLICCGVDTMVFKNAAESLLARFRNGESG